MKIAITIGSYKMPGFVALNLAMCRRIFPGCHLLVSDDRSHCSDEVYSQAVAQGASFVSSESRRSHTSGDWQAFINASVFADQVGADIWLKLSQRFIPAMPGFSGLILDPFKDPKIDLVLPGQMRRESAARSTAVFYSKFGLLTDVVACRTGSITPEQLADQYRAMVTSSTDAISPLVEINWGRLVDTHFEGRTFRSDALANPPAMERKLYLRKSQCYQHEYNLLASTVGMAGDFDMREWLMIEGRENYMCHPAVV